MESNGPTKNCPECSAETDVKTVVCECGHWFFQELEARQSTELKEIRRNARVEKLKTASVFGGSAILLLCVPAYWGGFFGDPASAITETVAPTVAEAPASKPAAPANDDALLGQGQFVVAAVLTGDRFIILDPNGRERRIRIFGTSSPKLDQPLGIESKENLSRLVLGKNVSISVRRTGTDSDVVADVMMSGTNIGLEQLRAGMVRLVEDEVAELNAEQQRVYAEADNVAKKGAFGLWAGSNGMSAPNQPVASYSSQVPAYRSTGPSQATTGPSENIATPGENRAVVAPDVDMPNTITRSQPTETQPAPAPSITAPPANTVISVDAKPAVPAPPLRQGPKVYTRGPRGGCFFVSASGNKTYVDRSLCN